jgi:type II secretory pathway pseudopilin PulG
MVVLMVLVTVLNVLVAAALPAWSGAIQREKEEELIFRGLQYAEAIRVFQARFGQPPAALEHLIEVEPRSIRRLWEDPLTGQARWGLIFAGGSAPVPGQVPGQGQGAPGAFGTDATQPPPITSGDPDQVTQGPISGVYSLARGEAMLEFQGKQSYSEWHFTVDILQQMVNQRAAGGGPGSIPGVGLPGAPPAGAGIPDLSSRWIGRPWPPALQQSLDQNLQQGGMPDGTGIRPSGNNPAGGGPAGGRPTRR